MTAIFETSDSANESSAELAKSSVHNRCTYHDMSYDYGREPYGLIGSTLGAHLESIAAKNPAKESLVGCLDGRRLTYADLLERSQRIACGLLAHGIARGDRVAIWSTNNVDWFCIFYACARIGAILVNINPGYRAPELQYALSQSGARLLFLIERNRTSNYIKILEEALVLMAISGSITLEQAIIIGDGSGEDSDRTQTKTQNKTQTSSQASSPTTHPNNSPNNSLGFPSGSAREKLERAGANFSGLLLLPELISAGESVTSKTFIERTKQVQFDDPVNIQYTSGTTGLPKGVTLSHHNLLNNAVLAAEMMGLDDNSRFCIPMPFYHCGGMVSSALATFSAGGTVVIPSPFFQALPTLIACQNESCTHLSGVPTMFISQLEEPDFKKYNLDSLSGGFMAGAPCPVHLMKRVASDLNMRNVVILYGLTESSPLMTATRFCDSLEKRAGTVGSVIPGVELKVIDPESGEIVPRGVQGEICCRGHNVMLGYWADKSATEQCIDSSRWLHSGDLGIMSESGHVNITGRKKDMICRGGENVYPREVEEVLHKHPVIAQAQVFGVPDDFLGEEAAMWVQLKAGMTICEDELRSWLSERVAHFKVPRYIRFVNEFPLTVTGKVQKFVMRKQMIDDLGLERAANIETA